MSPRILVTGSNGLLGQKLSQQLLATGTDFLATGTGANRNPQLEDRFYQTMDITNRDEVFSVIRDFKPTHIIHGAAQTNVDACESDRDGSWTLNVTATSYIVEACVQLGIHLTHVSTDFIFDGTAGPYKETDAPNPLSHYGTTKLAAEKLVLDAPVQAAILRTVLVYGVVPNMSRSNIVLWAKGALEAGNPINVVDDQFRTPTLAEDLAQGCLLAATKSATGIYNISGKDFMSVFELVERVAKHFGLPFSQVSKVSSSTLNQAAKRPPITGFVLDKAMNELGYQPHSFEEGLSVVAAQLKA